MVAALPLRACRWGAAAALALLAACGPEGVPPTGTATGPEQVAVQRSSPSPMTAAPTATPDHSAPPPTGNGLTVHAMPAPSTQVFAFHALVNGGPSGTIAVTTSGSAVRYSVQLGGLVPGSVHTIHDHLGTCAGVASSQHIDVLATPAANAQGAIAFARAVTPFLAGPGRIVIVYATAAPDRVIACADL